MILPKEIERLALKKQTSVLNIARDYLQAVFLSIFYQQKASPDFFFKGGTALHFAYQSPRFSEDLDFSAHAFDCWVFENLLGESLVEMEKVGLNPQLIESKPTTGGCLAIFSGLIGKLSVRIQVEISLRTPEQTKGQVVLVRSEYLPPFNVLLLDEEALVKGKIAALLTRKKPRDFYDLYFLLRSSLKIALSPEEKERIIKELGEINPRYLFDELKEFLPKSHHLIIKNLPEGLKRELERG